jgi:hypothetical protein
MKYERVATSLIEGVLRIVHTEGPPRTFIAGEFRTSIAGQSIKVLTQGLDHCAGGRPRESTCWTPPGNALLDDDVVGHGAHGHRVAAEKEDVRVVDKLGLGPGAPAVFSTRRSSRLISTLPVLLTSPKMTSSVRVPVSIRAVAKTVSDLPIGPADQ